MRNTSGANRVFLLGNVGFGMVTVFFIIEAIIICNLPLTEWHLPDF